jgi:hypothetical protein
MPRGKSSVTFGTEYNFYLLDLIEIKMPQETKHIAEKNVYERTGHIACPFCSKP